jgi:hypothetical protein
MPGAFYNGMVKNQQGSAAGVWQTSRGEKPELLDFSQSREKQAVKNFHVPRPARKRSLRRPREAG